MKELWILALPLCVSRLATMSVNSPASLPAPIGRAGPPLRPPDGDVAHPVVNGRTWKREPIGQFIQRQPFGNPKLPGLLPDVGGMRHNQNTCS